MINDRTPVNNQSPETPESDDRHYNVILTGCLLDGFDSDTVVLNLAKLFKTTPEKTADLLNQRETVLKRKVSIADAKRYVATLNQAGAAARIESGLGVASAEMTVNTDPAPSHPLSTREKSKLTERSLAPTEEPSNEPSRGSRELSIDSSQLQQHPAAVGASTQTGAGSQIISEGRNDPPHLQIETDAPSFFAFSAHGRIGRLCYLVYHSLSLLFLIIPAIFITPSAISNPAKGFGAGVLWLIPFLIVFFWQTIRYQILRLHDINISGKWLLAPLALVIIITLIQHNAEQNAIRLIYFCGDVLLIVWPGNKEENRFGLPSADSLVIRAAGGLILLLLLMSPFAELRYQAMLKQARERASQLQSGETALGGNAFAFTAPANVNFTCVDLPHAQSCLDTDNDGSPVELCKAETGFATYITVISKHLDVQPDSKDPESDFANAWSHCGRGGGVGGYYADRYAFQPITVDGLGGKDFLLASDAGEKDSMARVFVTPDYSVMLLGIRNPNLNRVDLIGDQNTAAIYIKQFVTSLHPLGGAQNH